MPRLFVNNLTVIDCSLLDPDRGLIGASWAVDIELRGELDQQSMVFDFAKVKKTIKRIIDHEVDHKLLVPSQFNGCELDHLENQTLNIRFTDRQEQLIEHRSPLEAVCLIDVERINREAVIHYLTTLILQALPDNVDELDIHLHEESEAGHYYCYSHGLKKHDGNCQRIAHGHRSQIQIWQNGQRSSKLEHSMAKRWNDIYLVTQEDIIEQNDDYLRCRYTTDQGTFDLRLATSRTHIMPCDSTVECIADHVLELLQQTYPQDHLKIKAFEGISKGAIAES